MPLSDPTQIWSIQDNLDVYTDRENKGQYITHLMAGQGPFKVLATYRWGTDPAHKDWPADFYFKILVPVDDPVTGTKIQREGWITGVNSCKWKISYTAPTPIPAPGGYEQYLVTIYPVTSNKAPEIQRIK